MKLLSCARPVMAAAALFLIAPSPVRPAKAEGVRCSAYVEWLRPQAQPFYAGPDRGQYGARHALPALAVFAREGGDPRLAKGIKTTLRSYSAWIDQQIADTGGVQSFEGETLLLLYARELRDKGHFDSQDEAWLRDTVLKLRRHAYGLKPRDGPWRGSQHRGMVEGTNNLLAAFAYPGEPQARQWQALGQQGWNDWWMFRDIGINDAAYFADSLAIALRTADITGRDEVFTDRQARATLWDRMVYETSPDGALIPYGWHAGWNGLAGVRIYALELAAKKTGEGRYRDVAGRLFRYAMVRGGFSPGQEHWAAISAESVALAAIACDDRIDPITPDSGSKALIRPEIVRYDPAQTRNLLPNGGQFDAGMGMTTRQMPSKLALRSGWDPGDMFMLVEAYPRHDPLNTTAILGFGRYGSAFAEMISEKEITRENAVHIADLSGEAAPVAGAQGLGRHRLPTGYAGMTSALEAFSDNPLATHARIGVENYEGFRARHEREFLFVKNRFVLVRDETAFADRFRAEVGPSWNTQAIGRRGATWADTWLNSHWYNADLKLYDNPPGRLLIWHAPRADAVMHVGPGEVPPIDASDQRAALRHFLTQRFVWTGQVAPGLRLQFTTLLLPHQPESDASRLAEAIRVLRDVPGLSAVAIDGGAEWELALLNEAGLRVTLATPGGEVVTDARALYLHGAKNMAPRISAQDASIITLSGAALHRTPSRTDLATN